MNRRQLLNAMLGSLALTVPFSAFAGQIRGARLWDSGEKLRLVLDLDGPLQYKTFSLSAPDRLIIDLANGRLAGDFSGLDLAGTPISAVRSGAHGANGSRIVLDLKEPMKLDSFLLPPGGGSGHRLVLDLQPSLPVPTLASNKKPLVVTQGATAPAEPVQAKLSKPSLQRDIIVVIDAGHGGKDPGAVGSNGAREKDVVLSIAHRLAKRINAQKGYTAKLVRNDDYYVPLRKRVEIAHKYHADMFVSVHADAAPRRTAKGASVYAISERGASSTTARFLAKSQNDVDLLGAQSLLNLSDKDPMLAGVILDMSMNATIANSLDLGGSVLDNLSDITGLHQKRVEQAAFAVLKSPDIPSILIETGFISNAYDCQRLRSPQHQQKLAESIFSGFHGYFSKRPPMNTYLAYVKERGQA